MPKNASFSVEVFHPRLIIPQAMHACVIVVRCTLVWCMHECDCKKQTVVGYYASWIFISKLDTRYNFLHIYIAI